MSTMTRAPKSEADLVASLTDQQRLELLNSLSDEELKALEYDWDFWARPNQKEPEGDWWSTWLLLAGRGFGKTRTGAELVRKYVEKGKAHRVGLVAATAADARDTMVEGESGLLAISPPWMRPKYEPSKRRLTWPNGAVATTYSADEPDRLRGPQHDLVWSDELAAWKDMAAWDMTQFGLRLGRLPRNVVTTTPRPLPVIKRLIGRKKSTVITKGTTYDNVANLAPSFMEEIIDQYAGTRLGRQELDAEILDDVPGALWNLAMFDERKSAPESLSKIVVGVDPSVSSNPGTSDETGIIVAGRSVLNHYYTLADYSLVGTPNEWASEAVRAYHIHRANKVVAEKNNGGEMVSTIINNIDPTIPVELVHASRGKYTRAEPVAQLYEQHRAWHVGVFGALETQMCSWSVELQDSNNADSPDRMDALVWAYFALMMGVESFVPITGGKSAVAKLKGISEGISDHKAAMITSIINRSRIR